MGFPVICPLGRNSVAVPTLELLKEPPQSMSIPSNVGLKVIVQIEYWRISILGVPVSRYRPNATKTELVTRC